MTTDHGISFFADIPIVKRNRASLKAQTSKRERRTLKIAFEFKENKGAVNIIHLPALCNLAADIYHKIKEASFGISLDLVYAVQTVCKTQKHDKINGISVQA